ncbi:uncharacterized protein [Amphiura filiformis]|uniref:uncharacterized protein n=1 Tax=Amphiura filiformis TaxID=82378 RepID=UPI003B227B7D
MIDETTVWTAEEETHTPLFIKTYSKCKVKAKGILQKPRLSPVFPADEQSFSNIRKWINIPTGSSCESEMLEEADPMDSPPVNKDFHPRNTGQGKTEAIKCNIKQQSNRKSFTPLINISNVLANKPCLSTFRAVSSPLKKGKKKRKQVGQLDSIRESDTDTDSTVTEEEYPMNQYRPRKTSSVSSTPMQSMQVAPTAKQSRKIGPMAGFNLMVKGNKILPLGIPLASSTAIDSGGTSETSEDIEDSSDYELATSSEPTDDSATLTEEMSSDDDDTLVGEDEDMRKEEEREEEDEIEIMRDFPDNNQLKIRGKQMNLTPKRITHKYPDPVKIPLERLSLSNSLSSGKKQVSFLLSSKENLPDCSIRKEPLQLPTKPSILKQSKSESRDISFSKSMVACDRKLNRMSSTPTRGGKKDKMMQLSFDVSAVHLPSYDITDLVVESVKENKQPLQISEVLPPVEIKESNLGVEMKSTSAHPNNTIDTTIIECQPPPAVTTTQPIQPDIATTQPSRTTTKSPISTRLPKTTIQLQATQPLESNTKVSKATIQPLITTVQPAITTSFLINDAVGLEDIPIPNDTNDMIEGPLLDSVETSSHATPRSQLKRSSPESHVPFTPSKRKYRMKGPSHVTEAIPHTQSSGEHLQRKRLEYEDRGVGPPECCITKLDHSTCSYDGVRVVRYVSDHKMTSTQLQQMPSDVLEVLYA